MKRLYFSTLLICLTLVISGQSVDHKSTETYLVVNSHEQSDTIELDAKITKTPNSQDEGEPGIEVSNKDWWWQDVKVIAAIVGVIGVILGALMKGGFETWSQKLNARRQMITSVTSNIEELAKNHYWLLANHSSVLAGLLNEYLMKREELQLQFHSNKNEMESKLKKLTKENYTNNAFFYYSRLIKAIYNFQWVTGNTYFLKDYWSGKILTKLYNRLQSTLQDSQIDANRILDVIDSPPKENGLSNKKGANKEGEEGEVTGFSENNYNNSGRDTLHTYIEKVKNNVDLNKEFERFEEWLENKPHKVWEASSCLNAYSTLFNYELGVLYKDWFGNLDFDISSRHLRNNPHLDFETKQTILRVSLEPITLQPVGIYSVTTDDKDRKEESREDTDHSKEPEKPDDKTRELKDDLPAGELTKEQLDSYFELYEETGVGKGTEFKLPVLKEGKTTFKDFVEGLIRGRNLSNAEKKMIGVILRDQQIT